VIAFALRLAWLFQPMRYDESITFLDTASSGFWPAWSQYGANNHVLHTLLVRLCTLWTSREWAIRLPAFVAGVLTPWVAYLVGRQLFDRGAALIGAALVACSAALIEYSTNARGYSMVTLFTLLQVMLADRIVRTARHRDLASFALVSAAGLFTIPTMLYPTITTLAWALLIAGTRSSQTPWRKLMLRAPLYVALGLLLVALLYTPVLLQKDGWHNLTDNKWIAPIDTFSGWRHALRGLTVGLWKEWSYGLTKAGLGLAIAFAIIAVIAYASRRNMRAMWVVVALVVCVGMMAVQRVAPFVRVFLFALPLLLLTAAAGLSMLISQRWAMRAALGLCVGLAIYDVASHAPDRASAFDKFPQAKAVIAFLLPHIDRPDDATVFGVVASAPTRYERFRTGQPPIPYRPGARRLWLVTRYDDAPAHVLYSNRLRADFFKKPKLVFKQGVAEVYELIPLAGRTPRQHRQPRP